MEVQGICLYIDNLQLSFSVINLVDTRIEHRYLYTKV